MKNKGQVSVQSIMGLLAMMFVFLVFIMVFDVVLPLLNTSMANLTYYSEILALFNLIPLIVGVLIIISVWMMARYREQQYA